MKNQALALLLSIFWGGCAIVSPPSATVIPEDQLLVLLIKGRYQDLDRRLQALQKAYIADRKTENDIHKALYAFNRSDPRVGRALNEWVAQQPNSAMPHLARGVYRSRMGWASRGSNWASKTSDSQFEGMAAWFNAAKEDLNQAAAIDPSLVEAYCYLIEIDMNEGGRRIRTLFNQALKVNPLSFIAREYFLHSQLPRWGGSYEEMQKTIENTRPYYKDAPQLKVLEGRVAADLGELAAYRKDYKEAIKYYDDALANGDFWFYNQRKGDALWEIDDYQGAIDQFSRVISYKPGYKRAWWMRSQAYKMLDLYPKALADISYAVNMEPQDDLPIAARGYIFRISGDLASALKDFRAAAKLDPTNRKHQQAIAEIEQLMGRSPPLK